jgi:hypothetical protein
LHHPVRVGNIPNPEGSSNAWKLKLSEEPIGLFRITCLRRNFIELSMFPCVGSSLIADDLFDVSHVHFITAVKSVYNENFEVKWYRILY